MRNLLDSNVLLRMIKPDKPVQGGKPDASDYEKLIAVIQHLISQGQRFCYTSQNLAEFWNGCTRPLGTANGYGLTPAEADDKASILERRFQLLEDTPDVHKEWRKIIVAHSVSGIAVHDARLVAAMRVHGVKRILTFDRDFLRYKELEVLNPQDLIKKLGHPDIAEFPPGLLPRRITP